MPKLCEEYSWLLWVAILGLLLPNCRSKDNKGKAEEPSQEASRTAPLSVTGASGRGDWSPKETMEGMRLISSFPTGLASTGGLALDAEDRCYVAHEKGVALFDDQGNRLGGWDVEGGAVCVDVGKDGQVAVCGSTFASIYDRDGALQETWGEAGEELGQFRLITGVAVQEGMVFLADAGNRCVHRYAVNGDFVNDLGKRGETEGQGIICPSPYLDCDVASDGRLHVINPGRFRVDVMASDGRLLFHWGKPGVERGFFHGCCNPTHLCLLAEGRTAVALKRPPGILVFEKPVEGREPQLLAWVDSPVFSKEDHGLDLAVDCKNRLWVLDVGAGTVFLFSLAFDPELDLAQGGGRNR